MKLFSVKNFKKIIFSLVIIFFIGTNFGAFGFSLMNHSNMETCPIGAVSGNDCTSITDGILFTLHHIADIQKFTQGVLLVDVSILIVFMVGLILRLPWISHKYISNIFIWILKRRINFPPILPYILSWIALHNKRGLSHNIQIGGLTL